MADNVLEPYTFSFRDANSASNGCSSRVWVFPTSILQSKIRVCGAQRSNESPSGAFKRQNGLRQQMEGPRPDKFADVYTSALLATTMKPLNAISKFENHFAIKTVHFQVSLDAGGYFLLRKFSSLQSQQAGRVGTNSRFLNLILQIRLQKHLLGFAQTRYSAQNCADCASSLTLNKQIFSGKICFRKISVDSFNIASNRNYYFRF